MGLMLNEPRPGAVPMPPPRLTSYRYWEEYRPEELRQIKARLDLVIDEKERQGDLFAPGGLFADQKPQEAPAAAPAPSPLAGRNETLGALLSPSQASCFLGCSARWWFKYGAGHADPRGGSACRGTAVHKCIEYWFRQQLAGATLDIEEMAEPYETAWEIATEETAFTGDDDPAELKRQGAVLLRKYLEEAAPEIKPAKLEKRVTGEIAGVRVQGWVDIVDVDGRIIDVKTAAKKPSGINPDYAFQLATYRQLLPGANGKTRLDTLVATKTAQLCTIEHETTVADQLLTQHLYPLVQNGIREGLYFPNRNNNLCSRKYCNFAAACEREFGGKVE